MKTHNIEIEGLPDGWKPVAITIIGQVDSCETIKALVHLEKNQPRRIVLEETDQEVPVGSIVPVKDCPVVVWCTDKIWKIVEEE